MQHRWEYGKSRQGLGRSEGMIILCSQNNNFQDTFVALEILLELCATSLAGLPRVVNARPGASPSVLQRQAELSSSRSTGLSYRRAKCVMPPPEKPSTVKTRSMSDSDILSSLSTELESLVKEICEFREESKKEMHEFREESKAMGKSMFDVIDVLKVEISQLQRELEQVKQELCDVQQYSRKNTVDIQGVPENKSENVFEVVKAVAKVLRFDLKPEMIDAVHRLAGGSGASRPRGIILKFVRRGDCDELLRVAKVKRGFPASELDFSSENKVFVNPSLSKAFRELLYHAKCAAREGRVRFVWYSNGKVLVRKRDGQPAIHITSKHQLQDLQRDGAS
ncbi:polycystic kidney disease protein 1-like [Homalodisca vitripennis]|nr:polycystic kidney disease protein 1-like [Homalodisca vitripennis]